MAYAGRDLARVVRAAVVRRGAVVVAALARGLSVRANDAMVVMWGEVDGEWVCFWWSGRVMVYRKDVSGYGGEYKCKRCVGKVCRTKGKKGRLEPHDITSQCAYTENDISARPRFKVCGGNLGAKM